MTPTYGCETLRFWGPVTVCPDHTSVHDPGGIQTDRVVTLEVEFQMGATNVSF